MKNLKQRQPSLQLIGKGGKLSVFIENSAELLIKMLAYLNVQTFK